MDPEYVLGMYEKAVPASLGWPARLRVARESGFDYVEISIDESDERLARLRWSADERRALARAVSETATPVSSMCLSAHRRYPLGARARSVRARSLDIMARAIDLACDLGVRTIQLAGYDVYYEPSDTGTRKRFAENLARVAEMAARSGVLLGFETMETPFMDTVEKAMRYVHEIGSPYLGVYPDIGNLTNASLRSGSPVADDIATGGGRIIACHCKETVAGAYREIAFGEGTTDYDGALAALVEQGVRRFVAEFWYVGSERWRQETSAAAAFVRARIEAALIGRGLSRPPAASCARTS
ncbi:L-xylulose 5-phosphate 3-epimerase [Coriobacterium glomerans PW2]|uniref:L-ribulose-5-phosphate 3-epimerase n=1 Tax=Coriobacterium glomerans (strain ATCC 49209 / DSM 20642 / JCM 10262 / PW2) TaxID=700015 RepID=F2N7C8_CORGP|nr:L-ribulose-5-phosphate 3-epimerase [Coriobacterium glomerans]AEB06603.1 L-xylulose 5-phosphate 3-epimerase [Coriobacterium glomerans PW2]